MPILHQRIQSILTASISEFKMYFKMVFETYFNKINLIVTSWYKFTKCIIHKPPDAILLTWCIENQLINIDIHPDWKDVMPHDTATYICSRKPFKLITYTYKMLSWPSVASPDARCVLGRIRVVTSVKLIHFTIYQNAVDVSGNRYIRFLKLL